jgi:hypothetical protein
VFQVILIHFLLISTESETFQQTGQTTSQSDSDSTENHFSGETETFLFLSESGTVPNAPIVFQTIKREDKHLFSYVPISYHIILQLLFMNHD